MENMPHNLSVELKDLVSAQWISKRSEYVSQRSSSLQEVNVGA
jgi:hypothetical protein